MAIGSNRSRCRLSRCPVHDHPAAEFPKSSVDAFFRELVAGEAQQMAVCNFRQSPGSFTSLGCLGSPTARPFVRVRLSAITHSVVRPMTPTWTREFTLSTHKSHRSCSIPVIQNGLSGHSKTGYCSGVLALIRACAGMRTDLHSSSKIASRRSPRAGI